MSPNERHISDLSDESALVVEQALRYAEDIARVYEEEKAKRRELEEANERLRSEIFERQRIEEALRNSEERFRAIFQTAQDCVYIKDSSLKYVEVNPALEHLFLLHASEIIGKTDRQLYGSEAAVHLEHVDLRVMAGETVEEEHTRPVNGIPTTFLETKAPLRDATGRIVGICGIARNVTDRWRKETVSRATDFEYPSQAMRTVIATARVVAFQESVVLLLGESGTGKDWLARYIHEHSRRAAGSFFAVNCASIAPELAESELFGHEPGAFTGARAKKRGLLELAEGGTLFLNEIGELSLALQAKLLTFLDSRSFTRVGGEKNISVNARLICATNRNLDEEVAAARFRSDLYYRINVMGIRIPPLKERKEDIPILVKQIAAQLEEDIRFEAPPTFDSDVIVALQSHDWPGNVRELRNRLERAFILSGGGRITKGLLDLNKPASDWTFATGFPESMTLNDATRDLKRSLVEEALRRAGGNRIRAADLLGISRNSINHYIKSLGAEG